MENINKTIIFCHEIDKKNQIITEIYEIFEKENKQKVNTLLLNPEDLKNEKKLEKLSKKYPNSEMLLIPYNSPEAITETLKHFKKIKWIQSSGIGIDKLKKSFKIIKKKKITLTNMKHTSSLPLAEWSILASLYFTKNTPYFLEKAKKKEWVTKIKGNDMMSNKNAVIIGLGSIGSAIAKKCFYGFDMKITGVKNNVNFVSEDMKVVVDKVICLEECMEVIGDFDYIYLALPGVDLGKFFNRELIRKMRKGVIIVNVGRGDVMDIDDIFWGIKEGIIKGVGLDVWDKEPVSQDSLYYQDKFIHERILNFCHKASITADVSAKRHDILEKNLAKYLNKEDLLNIVDIEKGY